MCLVALVKSRDGGVDEGTKVPEIMDEGVLTSRGCAANSRRIHQGVDGSKGLPLSSLRWQNLGGRSRCCSNDACSFNVHTTRPKRRLCHRSRTVRTIRYSTCLTMRYRMVFALSGGPFEPANGLPHSAYGCKIAAVCRKIVTNRVPSLCLPITKYAPAFPAGCCPCLCRHR